jgi:hydroxymethylpyrimidine pyrophosphatase-like HAD family hydrolase
VAAGDSGNDILMLEGGNKGIVVGNSQPELVSWVLRQPQSGRLVVTEAPMARGILEGLARHGLY